MLYTKDAALNFQQKENMKPALSIDIAFENYLQNYERCINALKTIVNRSVREERYYSIDGKTALSMR